MKSLRDPVDVAFGGALRARRTAHRMSLEDLGRRIGVTYQQIQKYETGANRVSVSTATRIAAALDCSVGDLMLAVEDGGDRRTSARAHRFARLFDRLPQHIAENLETLVESVIDTRTAAHPTDAPGASLRAH